MLYVEHPGKLTYYASRCFLVHTITRLLQLTSILANDNNYLPVIGLGLSDF